jgi:methyltransferase (TIGR00027 family)
VDQPDTQRLKLSRVQKVLGGAPANLKYAAIDFTATSLGEGLARAGYERGLKTFFIWEGVTMYLPGDVVRETLRWVSTNAAPGSSIVFDYAYEAAVTWLQNIDVNTLPEPAKQAVQRFRRIIAGEPWVFGLPEGKEREFLGSVGLELRNVMGFNSSEAVGKYLTRADGSVFGAFQASDRQWYLILEARCL